MDLEVIARLVKTEPAIITEEVFLDLFAFMWEYISRAMFLPGQIVQWNLIGNFGNLGALEVPRDLLINFGKWTNTHCFYHLKKDFFINMSWG